MPAPCLDAALSGAGLHACAVAARAAVPPGDRAGAVRKLADRSHPGAEQGRHRSARAARAGADLRAGDAGGGPQGVGGVARQSGGDGVSFPDIAAAVLSRTPPPRGRLVANQSLAELTWFRVGGAAQILFMPEDEEDLARLLADLPAEIPVTVIGLGSNLIVRDGGVPGVVVRLGRGFGDIAIEDLTLRIGAAVPDVKVARAAQEAGIAGLSFLRGIPGGIGGALRMNGGAYGREISDVVTEARAVDRAGRIHVLSSADLGLSYRHCAA